MDIPCTLYFLHIFTQLLTLCYHNSLYISSDKKSLRQGQLAYQTIRWIWRISCTQPNIFLFYYLIKYIYISAQQPTTCPTIVSVLPPCPILHSTHSLPFVSDIPPPSQSFPTPAPVLPPTSGAPRILRPTARPHHSAHRSKVQSTDPEHEQKECLAICFHCLH